MSPTDIKTADAVLAYGSKTKLALALGYSRQAIYDWKKFLPPKVAKIFLMAAQRDGITLSRRGKRAA
jgi:hypothetical protein